MAPVLFVATFTIEGLIRPGYDPLSMYVSALSFGPEGWIQILNFIVFGVLLLIFASSVAAAFREGKASKTGALLLRMIAVCILFSGPFVMDPMGTLPSAMTLHGIIHGALGGIAFTLMPISCFVFWRRFREDPKWLPLQQWSWAAGVIVAAAVVFLTIATKIPAAHDAFAPWFGLIQRMVIVPYMVWLFVFALGFYERN